MPPLTDRRGFSIWASLGLAVLVIASYAGTIFFFTVVLALDRTIFGNESFIHSKQLLARNGSYLVSLSIAMASFLPAAVVFGLLPLVAKRSLRSLGFFSLSKRDSILVPLASAWCIAYASTWQAVLARLGYPHHQGAYFEHFGASSPRELIAVFVVIGVIGPICQEIVFRGFLLNACARYLPFAIAALVNAMLAALLYRDVLLAAPSIMFAVTNAYVYRRSGSLVAPIVINGSVSIVALASFFFSRHQQ